jgi:ubiquinone/menaquinone biosynthesis C-methylase UbiE
MRTDNITLEEKRFECFDNLENYPSFHERHRIFPEIFENRNHKKILDIAAGMGVVGKRIKDFYHSEIICNDVTPSCLNVMNKNGLTTTSFDIDQNEKNFPFPDKHFDAIIALATIEHVINTDHFVTEINRMLTDDGYLYLSAPNYTGLMYLLPFLINGKTFHDPLKDESKYEFYAHVRYFTFNTLIEYISSFGFFPEKVYLGIPEESSRYKKLLSKSKLKAYLFKNFMKYLYITLSPRWASEPVICFKKTLNIPEKLNYKKVVL